MCPHSALSRSDAAAHSYVCPLVGKLPHQARPTATQAIDDIQATHLLHAHPSLIVMLSPTVFSSLSGAEDSLWLDINQAIPYQHIKTRIAG